MDLHWLVVFVVASFVFVLALRKPLGVVIWRAGGWGLGHTTEIGAGPFSTRSPPHFPRCPFPDNGQAPFRARWTDAQAAMRWSQPSRCWSLIAACGRGQKPRNVLVVTLDTLRADHVGSYGYGAAKTPNLDALAARGARFASATTTTPLTLSAHSSPVHRHLPPASRRARQHRVLRRGLADDARRGAQGEGLPHRRLRRRLRPRCPLGNRSGIRPLLRRFRSLRRRRPWPGRHPAEGRGGGGPRARVAEPEGPAAVLRVGAPLRPAFALRRARRISFAVSRQPAGGVRRRSGLHRRAGRTTPGAARGRRAAR